MLRLCVAGIVLAAAGVALGSPATLQINPGTSTVTVTLCLTVCGTQCDAEATPVSGSIVAGLDCLTQPANLILNDFHLLLNNTVTLNLNFGPFCGRFDSTGSGVGSNYGQPGTPMPPTPISGGTFAYVGVPSTTQGLLSYTSTNLVCVGLQAGGRPCADTIDLATLGAGSIDLGGNVQVAGRTVSMVLNVNSSGPIDPNNPGLGSLSIVGTITATGVVPVPAFDTFVAVLLGTNATLDAVCESDINQDGLVNGDDVQPYVDALF